VLEELGKTFPAALHGHYETLVDWLGDRSGGPLGQLLAKTACRTLADSLPSWAASAGPNPNHKLVQKMRKRLCALLSEDHGSGLTRLSAECLCALANTSLAEEAATDVMRLVSSAEKALKAFVHRGLAMDAPAQRRLCRQAWILGTAAEHLDAAPLGRAAQGRRGGDGACDGAADAAIDAVASSCAGLLVKICLQGPPTLRPSIVPCLGFILRRHAHLVQAVPGGGDVLDVLLMGLSLAEDTCKARTAETLASLLARYESMAEQDVPGSGEGTAGDWGATVAKCMQKPKASEAVQRLSTLQPQVLQLLRKTVSEVTARHAVAALACFSRLGVLHPSSALPDLVAASLASFAGVSGDVRRLLLRLVETSPQLLFSRLHEGVTMAAANLVGQQAAHGTLPLERWRFAFFCEAYSSQADSRAARARFLDALLAMLAAPAAQTGLAFSRREDLVAAEASRSLLAFSILLSLPFRGELEVAHILFAASRELTLRAAPLVLPDGVSLLEVRGNELFRTCISAVLLHELCQHLGGGSQATIERLLCLGSAARDGGAAEDRPLPAGFSRRPPPDVSEMVKELVDASEDPVALRRAVVGRIPVESPLLRAAVQPPAATKRAAAKQRATRGSKRKADALAATSEVRQPSLAAIAAGA